MRENTAAGMTKGKTMSRMAGIVLKRNRMQAAALAVTYVLTFALLVLLGFFYPSIEKTFDRYLEEYRLPEATILTAMIPKGSVKEALEEEGVRASALRVVLEAQTHFPNGKTLSCRYSGVPENDEERYYSVTKKEDVKPDGDCVMISSYFAVQNDIQPGDSIEISTLAGRKELTVTDIVSSPETISTSRDEFSWYDSNDFGVFFIAEALMEKLFPCGGYCNRIDLWFENGTDAAQILEKIESRLGDTVISASTYEGSDTQKQIRSSLDSTRAIVTYMPVLLIGMGILFSTLFFIQIVNRGEKQNGLMMAIGFDSRQISGIYMRCALRLTLCSAVVGFALGAVLLRAILQIYVGTYDLPFVLYDGSLLLLPFLLLAIVLIGVISSRLSCLRLGKLDPVLVFHAGATGQEKELPGWISRLKAGAFLKMSLCGIYRNRRRFWLSVLCGIACLALTFLAISVIASKNESIRYLFEERFRYDIAVRCKDEAALREVASLPGVKHAEQVTEMACKYGEETVLLAALPADQELTGIMSVTGEKLAVPPEGGILLEEGFAGRHHLAAGDQIVLNDMALTVDGIAREYYYSVQYVSEDTAEAFAGTKYCTALIALDGDRDLRDFVSNAAEIDGYQYYSARESREECVRSILSTLDLPCYIFALFSIIIGAVIVSTMNLVTIAQRRKKYATLYVLGTSMSGFLGLELPETVLQFAATMLLGSAPAILCAKAILQRMSAPSQEYVLVHPLQTLCISSGVVAGYLFIGILVMIRAIRRMNYLEVLSER